jgi:hypothetical protein
MKARRRYRPNRSELKGRDRTDYVSIRAHSIFTLKQRYAITKTGNRPKHLTMQKKASPMQRPCPVHPTTPTVVLIPSPHSIKPVSPFRVHGLLCTPFAATRGSIIACLIALVQHPLYLFTSVVLVQQPILPFRSEHFLLDRVDDSHGD